ncbi:3-deoxy-D-manno-octulosonic acid transferase [Undibacterium sp. YM2]|uniref:lipid IV(A) 3-deoxy-D-manno-octulosonic acid transferase n=1 Tax=Undibacterium sp. YM2 TaxID=2058625 RepID=UPI001331D076|nr:lipid IV(A) 3-deoxy-D-manno-octulosonic acid transferase [Undibacterium sp. YM2]BBB68863.1 3-deoxy-D-manno-octulosonic acid transferase [Undibacterium sp. YM2]
MRLLYSLVWGLSLPFALFRLWWRGRLEPGYRQHIGERLGFYPATASVPTIWVHAVSAGETRAAEPLIRALLARCPEHRILLTHMTATGRETGGKLFADVGPRLQQAFLPYDINWMIIRFLQHFSPQLCILIETEVWPNLIAQCEAKSIPVTLVNARLSEKSLRKAQRLASLILPAARAISSVAAQSNPDALRLHELGIEQPGVTGNMKFDVTPPPLMGERGAALRRSFGERQVILCASTRDGEEELILQAFVEQVPLLQTNPLLIITPRHPQRFDHVAGLLDSHGIKYLRRSSLNHEEIAPIGEDIQVILGDSMGEMYMYYAACDIAFVGGSLVPLGGHNLIEACAMGKPVLTGTHTFNFSEITDQAIASGAAFRVDGALSLFQQAHALLADKPTCQRMGEAAYTFFLQHQGATARTMLMLEKYL